MWVTLNKICKTPQNSKTTHQLTASTLLKYFKPHRSFYRKKNQVGTVGDRTGHDVYWSSFCFVSFFFFFSGIFGISSRVSVLL